MAGTDYSIYDPPINATNYPTLFTNFFSQLTTDVNAVEVIAAANAAYIAAIPTTGFQLNDGVAITLGTGSDTTISHTGTNTDINHTGTGDLVLTNTTNSITIGNTGTIFNNSITISSGTFIGNLAGTASNSALLNNLADTAFLRSGVADVKTGGALGFSDNVFAQFGTGNDLNIYHFNNDSYIRNDNGTLFIQSTEFISFIGAMKFGTHAAITTETNSGFITIVDAGGVPRKLAVVT